MSLSIQFCSLILQGLEINSWRCFYFRSKLPNKDNLIKNCLEKKVVGHTKIAEKSPQNTHRYEGDKLKVKQRLEAESQE